MITGKTKIFGVIADPIDHVRAPMVFNAIFAERGIDAVLVPFHLDLEHLEGQLRSLCQMPNMGGVCVTIPFKMAVASFCDELGVAAEMTGAVNAVRFEDGRMIGDNFDGEGFASGLIGEGIGVDGKSILLIGAGGAARAIGASLCRYGISRLGIANRTLSRAEDMSAMLARHEPKGIIQIVEHDKLDDAVKEYDIIVNTTSLGLNASDPMPCSLDGAESGAIIADIIMVPEVTSWMAAARERGLRVHSGHHMLDYQRDLIGRFIGAFPD